MITTICNAIKQRELIEFNYDGFYRKVEPHTLGVSKKGNDLLAAYQVEGGSKEGNVPGWKQFNLEKIERLNVLAESFTTPRPGYTKDDSRMIKIYCEL